MPPVLPSRRMTTGSRVRAQGRSVRPMLAPDDPAESALIASLPPAAYTAVVTSPDTTPGIGLVEAYDISADSGDSTLANVSTRGSIGTDDEVLISGFIIGEVADSTVVIRAIGPSLATAGLSNPLSDPTLSVYDSDGAVLATNDNWQDDPNSLDDRKHRARPQESRGIRHHPPSPGGRLHGDCLPARTTARESAWSRCTIFPREVQRIVALTGPLRAL